MNAELPTPTRDEVIARMTADDAPYAMDRVNVRGIEYRVFRHAPANLHEVYRSALRRGDDVLLAYQEERYSYAHSYRLAAAIAVRLRDEHGIGKGDRVAIVMRNYPEWCLVYMAVTSLGAVAVALNAWWKGEELRYGLTDSHSRFAFVDQERLIRLEPLLDKLAVRFCVARPSKPLPETVADLSSWLEGELPGEMPAGDVLPEDEASVYYTSGSTGYPKGVVLTQRAIISAVMSWEFALICGAMLIVPPEVRPLLEAWLSKGRGAFDVDPVPMPQNSMLLNLPLFHVTGCHVMFLMCFRFGRKLVMMYRWNPEEALRLIESHQITHIHGVPTQSWEIVNSPDFEKHDVNSVVSVGGGGAARPAEHLRRIKERFPQADPGTGYGLTETSALATAIAGDDYLGRPESAGRALPPLVDIKIIDDDGNSLAIGEDGEICIRSVANMRGYWNLPDDTASTLRDGWVYTGDIGHLDEDGFLFITDRAKDIVIRGGENISCTEVESALCEHPAVFEAAVFSMPDARLGEVPWAAVVVRPDAETTEEELANHVKERLAAFKVPARIELRRERLPRGATEKIDRRRIKEEASRGTGVSQS